MKTLSLILACAILCLSLFSCGKKNETATDSILSDNVSTETNTDVSNIGSGIESAVTNQMAEEAKNTLRENAESTSALIMDIVNPESYPGSGVFEGDSEYVIVHHLKDKLVTAHEFVNGISVGKEKISINLPVSHDELSALGFTLADENALKEAAPALGEASVTYCTPTEKEYIGFFTYNNTATDASADTLPVNTVLLTALNNFVIHEKLSGTSGIKDVCDTLGLPDYIEISAEADGASVMLSYANDKTDGEATFFFDGTTSNLIAVKICSERQMF